jgi:cytoskeletal protein RodZ
MEHRRTPNGKAYVPASWFIILTIMLCVGAAGWLGWLFVDSDPDTPTAGSTTPPPSLTTTPSPTIPTETTPSPTETTPSPTATTAEPEADRDAPVSVLNNTTIQGLAATFSAKVREAGWTNVNVGNWRGSIAGNTVYYPPRLEEQARVLGDDLGIDRILPSIAPMRTDRLTIILSGPQQ